MRLWGGVVMSISVNASAGATDPSAELAALSPPEVGRLSRPSRIHISALDGLRGVAVMMIVVFHFTPNFSSSTLGALAHHFTYYCLTGVTLFFVLSGYLITGILADTRDLPRYFINFYARRLLRISPLYYLVIILLVDLLPLMRSFHHPQFPMTIGAQVSLWFYVQNIYEAVHHQTIPLFMHFWSLAVEEHFYLIWPMLVFVLSRRSMAWVCGCCILAAIATRTFLIYKVGIDSDGTLLRLTPCHIDAMAIGGWMALVQRGGLPGRLLLTKARQLTYGLGAIMLSTILFPSSFLAPAWVVSSATVNACFFAAILAASAGIACEPLWKSLWDWMPLRQIGKLSYAIYMFHWLIGIFTADFFRQPKIARYFPLEQSVTGQWALVVIIFTLSLLASIVSWHLFEKHFLKLKRHFTSAEPRPALVQ
jgi:peptidoglycan/LPS O-acetylase OafA/YrhL